MAICGFSATPLYQFDPPNLAVLADIFWILTFRSGLKYEFGG